jgi:hypothetical protein
MSFINKKIKSILDKNTQVKPHYVSYGIALTQLMTVPVKELMLHLMYVQDIDPKTQPGQKLRNEMRSAFSDLDSKPYNEDFDLSWVGKSYKSVKETLGNINFTPGAFRKLSDVSHLNSEPAANSALAPNSLASTLSQKEVVKIIRKTGHDLWMAESMELPEHKREAYVKQQESIDSTQQSISNDLDRKPVGSDAPKEVFSATWDPDCLELPKKNTLPEIINPVLKDMGSMESDAKKQMGAILNDIKNKYNEFLARAKAGENDEYNTWGVTIKDRYHGVLSTTDRLDARSKALREVKTLIKDRNEQNKIDKIFKGSFKRAPKP